MQIYAVIPAYNESKTVGKIILMTKKYCNVIVVDDGSKDGTADIAKKAGAIVVRHEINMGYGKGLHDGINAALSHGADAVITLDSDGQHDPNDIPKFVKSLESGADIVIGSRFLEGKSWGTRKRMIALRLLALQFWVFTGLRLTDVQSGFRAYRAKVFDKIKLSESGMAFSVELPIKAKKLGYRFSEVPITIGKPAQLKSFSSALRQGKEIGVAIIKHSLL